jgi:5S rRNA maturation endonuclease (ribonuclease M5)
MSDNEKVKEIRLAYEFFHQKVEFTDVFAALFPDLISGNGNATCPFHEDEHKSFDLRNGFGYCHAGCKTSNGKKSFSSGDLYQKAREIKDPGTAIRQAIEEFGLTQEWERFLRKAKEPQAYIYTDENGNPLHRVQKIWPKDFKQYHWSSLQKAWRPGLKGARVVLYNLPAVMKAETIWFVEGEKDADNLMDLGITATTTPMGAAKIKNLQEKHDILAPLTGKQVVIVADGDPAGRKHAALVAQYLKDLAGSIRIIWDVRPDHDPANPPSDRTGWDISDLITLAGNKERARAQVNALLDKVDVWDGSIPKPVQDDDSGKKKRPAEILLDLFWTQEPQVHRDELGDVWILVQEKGAPLIMDAETSEFRGYLLVKAYNEGLGVFSDTVAKSCSTIIQSQAGNLPEQEMSTRYRAVMDPEETLLVDRGTADRKAIKVTKRKIEEVPVTDLIFRRFSSQAEIPPYMEDGDPWKIFSLLPPMDERSQMLLLAWLVASMKTDIHRPILVFHAPPGYGKTTAAEVIKMILDPSRLTHSLMPRKLDDLYVTLRTDALTVLDNVTSVNSSMSEALCALVTGGNIKVRKLYSGKDRLAFGHKGVLILTSLSNLAEKGDLIDRTLPIEFDDLKETGRRSHNEIIGQARRLQREIFSGLLDLYRKALSIYPEITLSKDISVLRMADFYRFAAAVIETQERKGWDAQKFLDAMRESQDDELREVAEESLLAKAIMQGLREYHKIDKEGNEVWKIPKSMLHKRLSSVISRNNMQWPFEFKNWTGRKLTMNIRQLIKALAAAGIEAREKKTAVARIWVFTRKKNERNAIERQLDRLDEDVLEPAPF